MKARFAVALMSVVALCACNSERDSDRDRDRDRDSRSERNNDDRERDEPAASETSGNAEVEQQLAAAAAAAQGQLPMEKGGATITAMEANGTELITSMTIPVDLTQAQADQIAGPMTTQQCNDPRLVGLIRQGARMTYVITDSEGEEFSITTSSCPA